MDPVCLSNIFMMPLGAYECGTHTHTVLLSSYIHIVKKHLCPNNVIAIWKKIYINCKKTYLYVYFNNHNYYQWDVTQIGILLDIATFILCSTLTFMQYLLFITATTESFTKMGHD